MKRTHRLARKQAVDSESTHAVEDDVPHFAGYLKNLRESLEKTSAELRERDLDELGQAASDFAKPNPSPVFFAGRRQEPIENVAKERTIGAQSLAVSAEYVWLASLSTFRLFQADGPGSQLGRR